MKKLIIILLLISLTLGVTGCNSVFGSIFITEDPIKIPDGMSKPDWSNQARLEGCYALGPSFNEEGFENDRVEIVLMDVTVSGYLEEILGLTYYSVDVNEVLLGSVPQKRIVLESLGNSTLGDKANYPLMERGERLIVITQKYRTEDLPPYEVWMDEKGVEPPEWLRDGLVFTVYSSCDVVEYEGELYVLDRHGYLTEPPVLNREIEPVDRYLKHDLVTQVTSQYKATGVLKYPYAFKYDDFVALVDKYSNSD